MYGGKELNKYKVNDETYLAYSHIIEEFKSKCGIELKYGGASTEEDEKAIANEIYTHFGTHYYKCINSLNDIKDKLEYRAIIKSVTSINILDIGCNIGTATYAYIDTFLNNKSEDESIIINVIFIEMSEIRVKYLKIMFSIYINEVNKKYNNVTIKYHIINEEFPIEIKKLEVKLIDGIILVLISNFTHWNDEHELAKRINELYSMNKEMYLLNIETGKQLYKITQIVNYMKKFRIYDINGPLLKTKFQYENLECSHWKSSVYKYHKSYYQTSIKEEDFFIYIMNKKRILKLANKTINTLSNFMISDYIEINYFIRNKNNLINIAMKSIKADRKLYNDNYIEYNVQKKDGTRRPLVIENSVNELISTGIIMSVGLCMDNIQNKDISFGNRIEEKEQTPFVIKQFMKQYFDNFIKKQKKIKEKNEYKYYIKLDLKSYYTTVNHDKLIESISDYLKDNNWFKHGQWLEYAIESYVKRKINGIGRDSGIPQGVPLSGLISNIYLNSYDQWFDKRFMEDKMFRYVDDIIIFTDNDTEGDINKYTEYLTNNLKLEINENKTEANEVALLEFYNLGEKYDYISELTRNIYNSIYNIPPHLYKLYIRNPSKIINLLHKSYKHIGINISASWLAKKIRKSKKYNKGRNINYGKMYGKKNININEWRKEFIRKNEKFIEEVNILKSMLEEEFKDVFVEIKINQDNTLIQRKFKFIFNKLGIFINKDLITEEVFNYIYDKPWLVDLKKLRGYDNIKELVFKNINTIGTEYCNIIFIWLIGEYEANEYLDDISNIYLETLEYYDKGLRIVNTMACTTLLKIISIDKCKYNGIDKIKSILKNKLIEQLDYIYIRNAMMILNTSGDNYVDSMNLEAYFADNSELKELLKWIKGNLGENIIDVLEPMYEEYGEYLPEEEPSMVLDYGY